MDVDMIDIYKLAAEEARQKKISDARRREEIRKNIPKSSGVGKALMADPAFRARIALF